MQESVLAKLGKNSISATDIANQFWCEKQVELNYLYGKKYTEQMQKGKQLHEELKAETYIPLNIEPVTYADLLYKIGYENYMALKVLGEKKVCRELTIYGSLGGFKVVGQIDELRLDENGVRIIELKTVDFRQGFSTNQSKLKPNIVQVMLYKKLLDDLRLRRYTLYNFSKAYGLQTKKLSDSFLRALHELGIKEEYTNISEIYRLMFDEFYAMPKVSDKLEIRYVDRLTGKQISNIIINYDEERINRDLSFALKYWQGEREAMPVSKEERWKCRLCKFYGKECKVWWPPG
ncbi:MAG: hypothetical protein ACP5GD_01345 [Candidatus Micrarchaeia archaeon]